MPRITVRIQEFADRATLQLQWYDPVTGQRRTRSARTADPELAERARADLEYELNHGLAGEPSQLTWAAFRQAFEAEHVAALRAHTQRGYRLTLDTFERDCQPGLLASVDQRVLSRWTALLRQRIKPSSIVLRLSHLRCALRWAADQDMLARVPKFPRVEVPKRLPRPVPAEMTERLLAAVGEDAALRAYLLCGWLAGLRRQEATVLRWEPSEEWPWIDLAGRRIWLPADFVKGRRDQWIPLDPGLQAALEALPRHGERVFEGTSDVWYKRLRKLAAAAGVRLNMRALRRGFVCHYAAKVPAQVLRQLARHADLSTTLDYYANVDQAVEQAVFGNTPVTPPHDSAGKSRPADYSL